MSTHSDRAMARRLEKLEEEVERLREQNAYLSSVLTPPMKFPFALRLSPALDTMLRTIAGHDYASEEMLNAALDWDKDEPNGGRVAHVHVSRLRKKLKPFGIDIKNSHGVGYFIEPEAKKALKRMERRAGE